MESTGSGQNLYAKIFLKVPFHTQLPRRFGVNVRFDAVGDGKPFMVSRFFGFCCEYHDF